MLFTFLPAANIFPAIRPLKDAITMLEILVVAASVAPTVLPFKDAIALFLALDEGATVFAPISILKRPLPIDLILLPVTSESTAFLGPCVRAKAIKFVVLDLPLISRAIRPSKGPLTSLFTPHEVSHVFGAIWPLFFALAMLQIASPVTLILDSIDAGKDAITVLLTIKPVALVDATISVDHPTSAVRLVVGPVTFKCALIVPHDGASALPAIGLLINLPVVSLAFLEYDLSENKHVLLLIVHSSAIVRQVVAYVSVLGCRYSILVHLVLEWPDPLKELFC